jgi:hypothetical protein
MTEADTKRLLAAIESIGSSLSTIVTLLENVVANLNSVIETKCILDKSHLRVGSVD